MGAVVGRSLSFHLRVPGSRPAKLSAMPRDALPNVTTATQKKSSSGYESTRDRPSAPSADRGARTTENKQNDPMKAGIPNTADHIHARRHLRSHMLNMSFISVSSANVRPLRLRTRQGEQYGSRPLLETPVHSSRMSKVTDGSSFRCSLMHFPCAPRPCASPLGKEMLISTGSVDVFFTVSPQKQHCHSNSGFFVFISNY